MNKLAIAGGKKLRNRPFPASPVLAKEEKKEILEVLDTGLMSGFVAIAGKPFYGGPKVLKLENDIKDYFKVKYAVCVNSATAGLHAAVAACGIGPGDEVIVPPYTMSASATAILMSNAIPVFADIEEDCFCISPQSIKKRITRHTKAILVVHLFGMSANMDPIMKLAKEHGLYVIEDCAQAPGAHYKGRLVGTIGDLGIFSLNQHKTITTGEGGFVITNNSKLALRCQLVRNHGEVIVSSMGVEDIDNMLGWNYRMTELEAAVGIAQFSKLDKLTKYRVNLANYLMSKLRGVEGLILPKIRKGCDHVYFLLPMRYDERKTGLARDIFVKAVQAEGVPLGAGYVRPIYFEPLYQKKVCYGKKGCPFKCGYYGGNVSYKKGICPVSERMHFKELVTTNICRYPVTKKDIDDAVSAIKKVMDNKNELLAKKGAGK